MKDELNKAAALRYRRGKDSVPKIVAKGRGQVAEKIIALARRHGIPIHEDRNMVEILAAMDLYEDIPTELYKAVAGILSYIYKITGRL